MKIKLNSCCSIQMRILHQAHHGVQNRPFHKLYLKSAMQMYQVFSTEKQSYQLERSFIPFYRMWNDILSCQALTKWTILTYSTVRYSSHLPSKNKCKQIISKQARWVNGFELNWWFIMLAIIVVMNQHWTIQRSIHIFPQQQRVNPISIHHSLPVHSIDCMLSSSANFRLAFLLYC